MGARHGALASMVARERFRMRGTADVQIIIASIFSRPLLLLFILVVLIKCGSRSEAPPSMSPLRAFFPSDKSLRKVELVISATTTCSKGHKVSVFLTIFFADCSVRNRPFGSYR